MYNNPYPSAYPYHYYTNVNTSSDYMTGSRQGEDQQVLNAILAGIKREANAIEFYRRLANVAPDHRHQNEILQALENKKAYLTHFTNLYMNFTGTQPVYHVDKIPFNSYRDGLQKAYKGEVDGFEEYQKSSLLTENPEVRSVFLWALTDKQDKAQRFGFLNNEASKKLTDYGDDPFVVNIEKATKKNKNFRTALWTGNHLQVTLMSIDVGESIGLEIHPNLDQFLRIEQGEGIVQMGDSKDRLDFKQKVYDDYAIVIPAGKWHNLTNTGNRPIKLYSIYAPPQHPFGTVHKTKAEAIAAEEGHHNH